MSEIGTWVGDLGQTCLTCSAGQAPENLQGGLAVNGVESFNLPQDAAPVLNASVASPAISPKPFI